MEKRFNLQHALIQSGLSSTETTHITGNGTTGSVSAVKLPH